MTFDELANKRESCRTYSEQNVSEADILSILQTAALSPSACNSQPWRFIACTEETAKKMPECIQVPLLPINKWVNQARAFIVICEMPARMMTGKFSQKYAQMDIGIATAAICYAATEKGMGTCILGSFTEEKVKKLLGIPQNVTVRLIVSLGYPSTETTRVKRRKDAKEIISINKW